eukprot:10301477-Lingulodinium_polyedra.AAC.1
MSARRPATNRASMPAHVRIRTHSAPRAEWATGSHPSGAPGTGRHRQKSSPSPTRNALSRNATMGPPAPRTA